MEKVSKTINILGVDYRVMEVDVVNKEEPQRGEINFLTGVIKLDRTMPTGLKNSTLMHEVLHGMFDLLGLDELRDDESKVTLISTALYHLFSTQDVFFQEERKEE